MSQSSFWPLIKIVPKNTNFKFVRFAKLAAFVSICLVILSFVAFATGGLRENPIDKFNSTNGSFGTKMGAVFADSFNFGIDFKGGTVLEAVATQPIELATVRERLEKMDYIKDAQVQSFDKPNQIMVRFLPIDNDNAQAVADHVKTDLQQVVNGITFPRTEVVGAKVSNELYINGVLALVVSILMMMIYIWFRFELQMGIGGVASLLHDVILTLGFMSVTRIEFSLTSIAAILTIVGYSMNDTVVVYDRLRENMRKFKKMSMSDLVDLSTNETLSRTIITGTTTLLALFGLTIIGGSTIQSFTIAMLFGVVIGTYSSIYVAAPFSVLVPRKNAPKAEKVIDDRP